MTFLARGAKWVPRRPASWPRAESGVPKRAESATAPKPLAHRASISRRVRGRANRPQWCPMARPLLEENELLRLKQGVGQLLPDPRIGDVERLHRGHILQHL